MSVLAFELLHFTEDNNLLHFDIEAVFQIADGHPDGFICRNCSRSWPVWLTYSTKPYLDQFPTDFSGPKNLRMSLTNASGSSSAAKWPPRGMAVHWRMSRKASCSTSEALTLPLKRLKSRFPKRDIAKSCAYWTQPPLKGMAWPTKKSLSSDARNRANRASSSGVARRGIGTVLKTS